MKGKNTFLRVLGYLKAFEAALDYDPIDEIGSRVRELESDVQLRGNEVAALIAEVREIRSASEARRPRRQITE
jgi:hypothetical protein